jgi:DNA-binding transcriptional ArsR family regulator
LHQVNLLYNVPLVATTTTVDADLSTASGRLFRVLADPTRVGLLRRLAEGEASVSELVAAVGCPPQSRVSNHLACLRWCGLVTTEKVGRRVIYRLADPRVLSLVDLACEVASPHMQRLASCARIGPDWV